jgi:hypothetical protein
MKQLNIPSVTGIIKVSPKRINKTSDYLRKMIYSNVYLIDNLTLNDQSLSSQLTLNRPASWSFCTSLHDKDFNTCTIDVAMRVYSTSDNLNEILPHGTSNITNKYDFKEILYYVYINPSINGDKCSLNGWCFKFFTSSAGIKLYQRQKYSWKPLSTHEITLNL